MKKYKFRYLTLFILFFIVFIIFFIRAYELFFQNPLALSYGQRNNIRRGMILDRSGHVLAVSRDMVSVAVRPAEITNKRNTARLLAKHLDIPEDTVLEALYSDKKFIFLKRKLHYEDISRLAALKLSGVIFEKEAHRYYPNGKLASSLIGFTGMDNSGLAGVEYQFNDTLTKDSQHSLTGNNVYLTINSFIQHKLETNLQEMMERTEAKGAMGIIMDIHNGDILGMASLPAFDPNNPENASTNNRTVSDIFEPGSTFKMFSLASLMNENLFRENKKYYCKGYFEYRNQKVRCTGVHGEQSMKDIIKNSCNSGMIQATWQMPIGRFYENIRYFGFGSGTDIDLPGEARGYIPHPKKWDMYLKMTIPIGQGIGVTGIQLVTAASAIANGGHLLKPNILEKMETSDGILISEKKTHIRLNVTDPQKTRKVLGYLNYVVTEGTGQLANLNLPGITVCGKTGTAMVADKSKYLEGKYNASFLGFFPCEKPEVTIFIMIEQPASGNYYGSTVAAPVFRQVLLDTIPLIYKGKILEISENPLNTRKTTPAFTKTAVMPDFTGLSKKEVLAILNQYYPGNHRLEGYGYAVQMVPAPGSPLTPPYQFTIKFIPYPQKKFPNGD